jgi:DNA invertase Pin-like site-specific DNA recombinase
VDTVTPTGRAALGIKAVLSQFVREQTSKATSDTLRHKIGAGEWVGPPPYGFRASEPGQTTLVPVLGELSVVRMILARRRGPKPVSYHRIAAELESSDVPARRGTWCGSTVRQIYERRNT